MPQTLAKPHPLIKKWIDEDHKREAENRRSRWPMRHDPIDGTAVKKRRLRIMSALFFEWERLGHRVKTDGYSSHVPYLEIGKRKIEFTLFEYERQRRRPLTDTEKYDSLYQHNKWRQVKEPTGELVFRVKTHLGNRVATEWRDRENLTLEDQLGDILARLLAAPALLDEEDERHREAERRRWEEEQKIAEQRRLQRIDAARWRHVLELAAIASQVARAREFLDALEQKLAAANPANGPSEELREWLNWARSKADQMDPMTRSVPDLHRENQAVNEWTYRD